MSKEVLETINEELQKMERSIVATPQSREFLDDFSSANHGSNDFLLTQMAVQYGYTLALEMIKEIIENKK